MKAQYLQEFYGGEGEIRTHETLSGSAVFKTAAINRSATSPRLLRLYRENGWGRASEGVG